MSPQLSRHRIAFLGRLAESLLARSVEVDMKRGEGGIGMGTFRLVGSPSCFVFVVVVEVVETSEDLQDLGMKLRLG